MPITPLHFGLIPLLSRATRRRMSVSAFIMANVVADIPVVLQIYGDKILSYGGTANIGTLHGVFTHNFVGAMVTGLVLGALR